MQTIQWCSKNVIFERFLKSAKNRHFWRFLRFSHHESINEIGKWYPKSGLALKAYTPHKITKNSVFRRGRKMAKIGHFWALGLKAVHKLFKKRNYNMEESTSACPGGMQTSYKKPVVRQGRVLGREMGPKIQNLTWPRIATQWGSRGRGNLNSEWRTSFNFWSLGFNRWVWCVERHPDDSCVKVDP